VRTQSVNIVRKPDTNLERYADGVLSAARRLMFTSGGGAPTDFSKYSAESAFGGVAVNSM